MPSADFLDDPPPGGGGASQAAEPLAGDAPAADGDGSLGIGGLRDAGSR